MALDSAYHRSMSFNDKTAAEKDIGAAATTLDVSKGDIITLDQARRATEKQHDLTLKDALKLYRPAIGWSFLFSLGVIVGAWHGYCHLLEHANSPSDGRF